MPTQLLASRLFLSGYDLLEFKTGEHGPLTMPPNFRKLADRGFILQGMSRLRTNKNRRRTPAPAAFELKSGLRGPCPIPRAPNTYVYIYTYTYTYKIDKQ